jgi:hypothetical protein
MRYENANRKEMGMNGPRNEQMKPIIMAIGAAAAAAIAAMMLPASFIEGITGATGLSELIPATAAPLGPKARAIISFFAGAVTLMMAMGYLMRRSPDAQGNVQANAQASTSNVVHSPYISDIEHSGASLVSKLQKRMSGLKATSVSLPSMPWAKKREDDILDLADLPRLREHDSHPDAPARRPISALTDLSDASLTKRAAPLPSPALPSAPPEPSIAMAPMVKSPSLFESTVAEITATIPTVAPQAAVPQAVVPQTAAPRETAAYRVPPAALPHTIAKVASPNDGVKQSLQDLMVQLESAIENRLEQIAAFENLSVSGMNAYADLPVNNLPVATQPMPVSAPIPAPVISAAVVPRPTLEAVPTPPRSAQDDDMDAALNAALETLQRMNARAG